MGDQIALTFEDAINLEDGGGELDLVASTPYGDVEFAWRVDPDGTVWLQNVGLLAP